MNKSDRSTETVSKKIEWPLFFGLYCLTVGENSQDAPQITQMLRDWSGGKPEVLDDLLPLVYSELHRQAARFLRNERSGHTLQTTALINEAYLKLVDRSDVEWQSRTHFFSVAAIAMRHILVDHARKKHREKRGGDNVIVSLDDAPQIAGQNMNVDLVALDEALDRLAKLDPQQARVVELRYFSGLSLEETASALGISRATTARDWETARIWLYRELTR